jgi:aminocarboxymuconate-semialdehyde decarboxylase
MVFEGRVPDMTAAGLGMSVISVPAVAFLTEALAVEAARESNRELIEAAASDREHFRVMASLPLPFVDACLEELAIVAASRLVSALIMPAVSVGWTLDEQRFRPLWAAIAQSGLPVMLHPSLDPWPAGFERWRLGPGAWVPVELSAAALDLILAGVLDEQPDLRLIVPQLGGVLPYLAQRLVDRGQGDARFDVMHYLRNRLYYDNNSYHPPALRCAIETVGADRIMLGSDHPFRGPLALCVDDVLTAGLSDQDRDAILSSTARAILRNL